MKIRVCVPIGAVLFLILAFCVWYSIAGNYGYAALAGTYTFRDKAETCTLYLRADRTFEQELVHSGETQKSEGNWYRYGESHVSFSNKFLKLSGEEVNAEGEAHGEFEKVIGIFPTLVLAPIPNGPKFHKRLFSWN